MRIILTVSYDGTLYNGWQIQKNGETVQGVLEKVLFNITGEKIKVTGSGRTDAGVHAEAQVCHFDTEKTNIPPEKYKFCLNTHLPSDIRILKSELADDSFHARFSAKRKTYIYNMYISDVILPLKDRYALRIDNCDIEIMQETAKKFLGKHNFAAFSATGSLVVNCERELFDINIENCNNNKDIKIIITGNGFLYNMVRIISGTLLGVSQGRINTDNIDKALNSGNRNFAGKTLEAKGLVLKKVEYTNE